MNLCSYITCRFGAIPMHRRDAAATCIIALPTCAITPASVPPVITHASRSSCPPSEPACRLSAAFARPVVNAFSSTFGISSSCAAPVTESTTDGGLSCQPSIRRSMTFSLRAASSWLITANFAWPSVSFSSTKSTKPCVALSGVSTPSALCVMGFRWSASMRMPSSFASSSLVLSGSL